MKKNNQLHIFVQTKLLNALLKEAEENEVNLSEWCRTKLRKKPQLDRIEEKLDKFIKSKK